MLDRQTIASILVKRVRELEWPDVKVVKVDQLNYLPRIIKLKIDPDLFNNKPKLHGTAEFDRKDITKNERITAALHGMMDQVHHRYKWAVTTFRPGSNAFCSLVDDQYLSVNEDGIPAIHVQTFRDNETTMLKVTIWIDGVPY